MKTSKFTKSVFLFCVMTFLGLNSISAQEYAPPAAAITAGSWNILDWQTNATKTDNWGGLTMWHAVWSGNTVSIANSPTDAANSCLKWYKEGAWGGIKLATNTITKYIDFSRWDSIKFDIYTTDVDFSRFEIRFIKQGTSSIYGSYASGPGITITYNPTKAANTWHTISVGMNQIAIDATSSLATSFGGFQITPNNNSSVNTIVYLDNVRFVKAPGVTTSLNNSAATNLKISLNAANSELQLNGATGKVSVYNMAGAEVIRMNNFQGEVINISKLAKGTYVVKSTMGVAKFIKL